MRVFGWDLIRGGHYGQRSCEPHLKAEHMAAPTNAAKREKTLLPIRSRPHMARRGVEGPLQVIEGPNRIDNLLHMQIHIGWDKQGYEGGFESTIKKYNSMIHTQYAVH